MPHCSVSEELCCQAGAIVIITNYIGSAPFILLCVVIAPSGRVKTGQTAIQRFVKRQELTTLFAVARTAIDFVVHSVMDSKRPITGR